MGQRAFIVTQSIKKLPAEDRAWALKKTGFKRLSDDKPVDLTKLTDDDKNQLYYKDEPLTTKKLDQKLSESHPCGADLSGRKNGCKWLSKKTAQKSK